MAWDTDLMNSMGMNVTPVYGQQAPSSGGPFDAGAQADISLALAQRREEADRTYTLNKRIAKQNYEVALANARTSRDVMKANREYQQAQAENARQRLQFDRESFAQTHALNQAKLGYDVLNMAANLRGPENYYQSANFARGVAANPNSSVYLNALKNNIHMPDFGAQYGVPDPETLSTLSSKLGTTLGDGAPAAASAIGSGDDSLNMIRGLYAAGAHKLGAGALEQLTGSELKLLNSGVDAIGGDFSTFLDQYRRSRVGQGIGNVSAA